MNPQVRYYGAWILLLGSLVGWPLSIFWFARGEPVFVLSLSWLALTLTSIDIIETTDVRRKQEEEDE